MEKNGGGGGGGTNKAGARRPAGGRPGGACGCLGRRALLRNRPGPFVNHLFHALRQKRREIRNNGRKQGGSICV